MAEIKRMYSRPGTRSVGRTVLAEHEAAGYTEREAYGKYVGQPAAICMGKRLA